MRDGDTSPSTSNPLPTKLNYVSLHPQSPPLTIGETVLKESDDLVILGRGRVDDFSFFDYLSPFCFLSIEFHCTFFISYKIYHILYIIIVFSLGFDRPSGLILFVPALLLFMLTPLFLPSSSDSLSYFVLAVPMRECLENHSCMSSPCPIAILNGTFLFREAK